MLIMKDKLTWNVTHHSLCQQTLKCLLSARCLFLLFSNLIYIFFGGVVVPKNLFFDVILCSASGFIGEIIDVSKAGV